MTENYLINWMEFKRQEQIRSCAILSHEMTLTKVFGEKIAKNLLEQMSQEVQQSPFDIYDYLLKEVPFEIQFKANLDCIDTDNFIMKKAYQDWYQYVNNPDYINWIIERRKNRIRA